MMTTNLKTQAAQRAKKLLWDIGIQTIPVDVYSIAKQLEVKVTKEVLDDNTSGVIVIKDNQAVIGVNRTHSANRQRFTVAHELGHFLLHAKKASVFIDSAKTFFRDTNTTEGIDIQEIQANAFAAELLMPEDQIEQYVQTYGIDFYDAESIKQMAQKFKVSEKAITVRLTTLGYEPF